MRVCCVIKEEGRRRPEEKQNQTFGSHQKFPCKSLAKDDGADHENRVGDHDNDK